jgi:mono/diheme cytochrome c family protein
VGQVLDKGFALFVLFMMVSAVRVLAAGSAGGGLEPRVPADQLAVARAEINPLPATPENLKKGRAIYEGKGTCYLCHGEDGKGYGPEAAGLDPSPSNLTDVAWHGARTDGELMWVLRHGIANTNMPAFVGKGLTEEEGWAVIHYLRQLKGK